MRVILQRVTHASVIVDDKTAGAIDQGLLLFVGITHSDTTQQASWLAHKIIGLRIFRSISGPSHFDRSLMDVGGAILVVSQFTLYGDARKGRRPDFSKAARPEAAAPLIDFFCDQLRNAGARVEKGIFGADMRVELANDGPVTLILDV